MGRRKATLIPQKLSETKRQCLSWDMTDSFETKDILITTEDPDNLDSTNNPCESQETDTEDVSHLELKSPLISGDLYVDNVQTVQKLSVGKMGCFSAVKINTQDFENHIIKTDDCKNAEFVRLHEKDSSNKPYIVQINGINFSQFDALQYLQSKVFICILNESITQDEMTGNVTMSFAVYLNYTALNKVKISNEDHCLKLGDKKMKILLKWFYNLGPDTVEYCVEGNSDDGLETLFDELKNIQRCGHDETEKSLLQHDVTLQHEALVPLLRQYQLKSVKWMIQRETRKESDASSKGNHPLWQEIMVGDKLAYYNPFTGWITLEKQYHKGYPSGGILADEMGLGKTVEVLACILNHPKREKAPENVLKKLPAQSDDTSDHQTLVNNHNVIVRYDIEESCENNTTKDWSENINGSLVTYGCVCGNTVAIHEDVLKCSSCNAYQHSVCVGLLSTSSKERYICPDCTVKGPIIESRATLIISPMTISHQWLDEIHRHVLPGSLDVFIYEGVSKQGFVDPAILADNDVILTTYEALKKDFHHLKTNKGGNHRHLRNQKRYASWPCPLTCIKFWRICLDEAQMVESTTAKAAETALNLLAVHRWCVTGTPIQRGIEDLYGLLLFLGVEPYYRKSWWKKLLSEPFQKGNPLPLLNVLKHVMWRTAKKDVINEIDLPEQQENINWLHFSPVEDHFYRRQHEECSTSAFKEINKLHDSTTILNNLDKSSLQKVMGPLLRLRQACCHPQAVRGCFVNFQKSTITMEQLLDTLIIKAKSECEEAHRLLLCAINGLAGTFILQENWPQVVDTYREAMSSWREHEELIKTDSLQKLHTLYNLNEILQRGISGCSRTLRDDYLSEEAAELGEQYLKRWRNQVTLAENEFNAVYETLCQHKQKVDFKCPWWSVFFSKINNFENNADFIVEKNEPEKLLSKVRDDILSFNNTNESLKMVNSFTDIRGLEYILFTRLDAIEKCHDNLMLELRNLSDKPSKETITSTAECCLRPSASNKAKRCDYCNVDDIFGVYESLLFGHQGINNIDHDSQQTAGGLRGESVVERTLKSIYTFMKNHNRHGEKRSELSEQAQTYFEYFDLMKKNFKVYRQFWFSLRELVSAHDELEMCTTRLRLRFPGEQPEENQIHIINPIEISITQMRFRSDRVIANSSLRKAIGQLLYLKNLAKNEIKTGGENTEPCPVCTKPLGKQWNVFPCGHCVCCQCLWLLLNQPRLPGRLNNQLKCPLCRCLTAADDISYVSTSASECEQEDGIVVKGSHSTKIEAIVKTLLEIRKLDSSAKTIVFSTWQDVLDHISHALTENDVQHRRIKGRKDFQENLDKFKLDANIHVLLLPLQSGSNGLNIIEATHVILVEPSLNPALEKQAVGRIHRIGQTKPTFVHRFLIRKTVEEKIANTLQAKPLSAIRCGTRRTDKDLIPLTIGELTSFFEMPVEIPTC